MSSGARDWFRACAFVVGALVVGACSDGSSLISGRLVSVNGRDVAGATLEAVKGGSFGGGTRLVGLTIGKSGKFEIEVPARLAGTGAAAFRITFANADRLYGKVWLDDGDVNLGNVPIWEPQLEVERVDGATRLTWQVPDELRDRVDARLGVQAPNYQLAAYTGLDRSIDLGDWVLSDFSAEASLSLLYPKQPDVWYLDLDPPPASLPTAQTKSLAAGLPCYLAYAGATNLSKVDPCPFMAPYTGDGSDTYCGDVGESVCIHSVEIDLGQVRNVRHIALQNLLTVYDSEHSEVFDGDVPQFLIEAALPRDVAPSPYFTQGFQPLAYVAAPLGAYLLDLAEPVPMRYVRVTSLGELRPYGNIGVFE